jgi:signal transduction histidine kinase
VLPKPFVKGFDKRRLRNLLALFFIALAAPTAVLIWQAYGQLKFEAYHQQRSVAEELTRQIDNRLNDMVRIADARSFADYSFLVVSGDPDAKFVQRSPLSAFPVSESLPSVMGHFQVDSDGEFSTPLLPPDGTEVSDLGISGAEYSERVQLARKIQEVLADNKLVQSRADTRGRRSVGLSAAAPAAVVEEEKEADVLEDYDQSVFDELTQRQSASQRLVETKATAEIRKQTDGGMLDESEQFLSVDEAEPAPGRSKRRENIALPESVAPAEAGSIANLAAPTSLRISTFESEVDPLEFSLLGSGHFVFYRKVWRDGERYIQGFVVDQEAFLSEAIGAQFIGTALSGITGLAVVFQDDVVRVFENVASYRYPGAPTMPDGELLYRSRLSAPLSSLELIFSINYLPPGAGAGVLGWVTLVIAVVFLGGFAALYKLGLSQIRLARQQQDFVASVSHELKTPLTSIRMYGEILKEGWADKEKRQQYYEFIHDESERLSRLISNVLQLARITRNEPQFDLKSIRVGELMSNTESRISSQVERAGFELRFVQDDDVSAAIIDIDEDCFTQIIINLVDNAIKFSRDTTEKTIVVSCKRTAGDKVRFSVRDYGPGVAKSQMKKIFELFYRSESELTRETVGTGIGLAIVYQLTAAMGGSVDLVNVEPGAEFRVEFPANYQAIP